LAHRAPSHPPAWEERGAFQKLADLRIAWRAPRVSNHEGGYSSWRQINLRITLVRAAQH
jgi:hypothetical protein